MNLHDWISARVEAVERLAHEAEAGIWTAAEGPHSTAGAIQRRCEADRRVLARHTLPDPGHWLYPGCAGCGTEGDCDDPVTDNINDCPELLDLAHAHGITPGELAALDRIERVGVVPVVPFPRMAVAPAMTTADVPASLRGRVTVVHAQAAASNASMVEAIRQALLRASRFGVRR